MIPTRGWRDRELRARARHKGVTVDPTVRAARDRLLAEREAKIEALRSAEAETPVGIVTAATFAPQAEAPVVADVTPDEPEVAETAAEEPAAAEPVVEAPKPAPKSRAKK